MLGQVECTRQGLGRDHWQRLGAGGAHRRLLVTMNQPRRGGTPGASRRCVRRVRSACLSSVRTLLIAWNALLYAKSGETSWSPFRVDGKVMKQNKATLVSSSHTLEAGQSSPTSLFSGIPHASESSGTIRANRGRGTASSLLTYVDHIDHLERSLRLRTHLIQPKATITPWQEYHLDDSRTAGRLAGGDTGRRAS